MLVIGVQRDGGTFLEAPKCTSFAISLSLSLVAWMTTRSPTLRSFIRHLPRMKPDEINEMEQLNPKSAMERWEESDEQLFLNEGKTPEVDAKKHH